METGATKLNRGALVFGRSSLFNRALTACGNLRAQHPDNVTIKSIISQLHYLIELDAGKTKDRSRLDTIVIGVLARCEIEYLDTKVAKLLEKVAEEARKMEAQTPEAPPMLKRKESVRPAVTSTLTRAPADALDEAATPPPAPVAPASSSRPSACAATSWSLRR